jgi:hypothetical protein
VGDRARSKARGHSCGGVCFGLRSAQAVRYNVRVGDQKWLSAIRSLWKRRSSRSWRCGGASWGWRIVRERGCEAGGDGEGCAARRARDLQRHDQDVPDGGGVDVTWTTRAWERVLKKKVLKEILQCVGKL